MDDAQFAKFMDLIQTQFQEMGRRFDRLEQRMDRLEQRMDRLEQRMDSLESRMDSLESRFDRFETEVRERFQSLNDRMDAFELRMTHFDATLNAVREELAALRVTVEKLNDRTYGVESNIYDLTTRINVLSDDMRQRFRSVTERLAG